MIYLIKLVLNIIKAPTILLLILSAVFYMLFVQAFIGIAVLIMTILFIITFIIMEKKSEGIFEKLELEHEDNTIKVLRNGEVISLSKNEVAIGDFVYLNSKELVYQFIQKFIFFAKKIAAIGVFLTAVFLLFKLFIMFGNNNISFYVIGELFIFYIMLVVLIIPSNIASTLMFLLASKIKKMLKHNIFIKASEKIDTISMTDVICSGKTGIFTKKQMIASDVWINGAEVAIYEINNFEMIQNICINSTAEVYFKREKREYSGQPIECALLECAEKNRAFYGYIRKKVEKDIVFEYPFTSERKMRSVALKDGSGFIIYTKGSPSKILGLCDRVLYKDHEITLDGKILENIDAKIKELQRQGKIVIAFAYKNVKDEQDWQDEKGIERYLVFNGFIALEQPIRSDAKEAVQKCKEAGIKVKMITGDDIETATAIAKQAGLIEDSSLIYSVSDIEKMCDEEFKKHIDKMVILAGSTPSSKARVIRLLKEKGRCVMVTGEDKRDIPAIRAADTAAAMGTESSEAAKAASDLVIDNGSFFSIIRAIIFSREICKGFKKILAIDTSLRIPFFLAIFLCWIFEVGITFLMVYIIVFKLLVEGIIPLLVGRKIKG